MPKSHIKYSAKTVTKIFIDKYSLALAVVASSLILFVIFNSIQKKGSAYGLNDHHEKVTIIQSSTSVLRGTKQQCLVGIEVDASSLKTPFTISAIEFQINGSPAVISKHISNGMLWYTGSSNSFDTYKQLGDTISVISKYPFKIDVNKYLKKGKNYFWFAVDINEKATADTEIDVDCYGVSVEGHYILPTESNPEGSMTIINNRPFYSLRDGKVNDLSIWNSQRDGSGSNPISLDKEDVSLIVTKNHKVSVFDPLKTGYIVLERGAYLKSYNDIACAKLIIESGGIYEQSVPLSTPEQIQFIEALNGATVIHNNKGQYPGQKHLYHKLSNQYFFDYSEKTFINSPTTWGNLEVRVESKDTVDLSGVLSVIQGNLLIKNSGPFVFSLTDSIRIAGNFIMHGGQILGNTGSYNTVWDITGDFIMTGGLFSDINKDSYENSASTIILNGDIELSEGEFNMSGSDKSAIYLKANKYPTHWSQKAEYVQLSNIYVDSGRTLNIIDDNIKGLGQGKTFELKANSTLLCGNYSIEGEGTFSIKDDASIYIGSADGINSNKLRGNILTENRFFSSGANYIYYGSFSPQQTGVFVTSPMEGTVNNFVIQKEKDDQKVILNNNITVSGEFREEKGTLEKNGKSMKLMHMSGKKTDHRGGIYSEKTVKNKI